MVVVKTVDACYLKKTNAMEQPELMVEDIRVFARTLR